MPDQVAMLGVSLSDPTIPWPARGSGERKLSPREGWELKTITTMDRGQPREIEAMVRGELAVNVMLEGEGMAICIAASGFRLSHKGRVFARCQDAMICAEAMMLANGTWGSIPHVGFNSDHRHILGRLLDAAEQHGEILLDRVFPT